MKTFHCEIRQQQRGIKDQILDLILSFGIEFPAPGDAQVLELPREFLQLVDQAMKCRLITANGQIVTVEHKHKGIKKVKKDKSPIVPFKLISRN